MNNEGLTKADLEKINDIVKSRYKRETETQLGVLHDKIRLLEMNEVRLNQLISEMKSQLDTKDGQIELLKRRMKTRVSVSPKKQSDMARKTQSMVHLLPTQYSSDDEEELGKVEIFRSSPIATQDPPLTCQIPLTLSSSPPLLKPPPRKKMKLKNETNRSSPVKLNLASTQLSSSPVKKEYDFKKEDEVIEDSQDEDSIPIPHQLHTINQKRQYLTQLYIDKFKCEPNFKICLSINPIHQTDWVFSDFISNDNHEPDEISKFIKRNNIMNVEDYKRYKRLYNLSNGVQDIPELNETEFNKRESQIFNKFPSPPGFMKSEFPNTQEANERRAIVNNRQLDRVKRRIEECCRLNSLGEQIGEYVFTIGILNDYVRSNRWYLK